MLFYSESQSWKIVFIVKAFCHEGQTTKYERKKNELKFLNLFIAETLETFQSIKSVM